MSIAGIMVFFFALLLPAWGTAAVFTCGCRLFWRRCWRKGWLVNYTLLALAGSAVLFMVLLVTGVDGTVLSYGAMLVSFVLLQLLLLE